MLQISSILPSIGWLCLKSQKTNASNKWYSPVYEGPFPNSTCNDCTYFGSDNHFNKHHLPQNLPSSFLWIVFTGFFNVLKGMVFNKVPTFRDNEKDCRLCVNPWTWTDSNSYNSCMWKRFTTEYNPPCQIPGSFVFLHSTILPTIDLHTHTLSNNSTTFEYKRCERLFCYFTFYKVSQKGAPGTFSIVGGISTWR